MQEIIDEEKVDRAIMKTEEQNILRFVEAVERDEDLELLGTNADVIIAEDGIKKYHIDELFVLRDKRIDKGLVGVSEAAGSHPKMEIVEVMKKCTTEDRVKHILGCLKGEENSIRLQGITRIVGYYSRVHSWNKSKIGELRDRGEGVYKFKGGQTETQGRHQAIAQY